MDYFFLSLLYAIGPIGLVLGIFYLIVLPIWVISLQKRVKLLEQGKSVAAPQPMRASERPVAAPIVETKKPMQKTESKPKQVATRSLEEQVGGHWFQWIGIAALVAALLFFLKWSFDNGIIGPTGRTVIGYVLCAAAMVAGDKLKGRYGTWSLAFTGGGALGSYIVTWIGLHTYHLFPTEIAFAIYILTTVVSCLLAGHYNSLPLAAFGIIGGFVTPVLTGSEGSMLGLLSYIIVLDAGIVVLAHMRRWHQLNALALLGTLLYEAIAYMNPGTFTQGHALLFGTVFFAIYLSVSIAYTLWKKIPSEGPDVMLLVVNALAHFGLVLLWLGNTPGLRETYDAGIALGLAIIFLIFSTQLYKFNRTDVPMVLGGLSLTVLFATLTIPMQFDGAWIPLAWSIEGAFLLYMALALKDKNIRVFAWLVMVLAYVWYFFGTTNAGQQIAFGGHGLYLFFVWVVLMLAIALYGLSHSERHAQSIVAFVFVGFAVLTGALCMNMYLGSESQLTGLQRFFEFAALIGGSYGVLFMARKQWGSLAEDEQRAFTVLGIGTQVMTVMYLTDEYLRAIERGAILWGASRSMQQIGVSILWAVYAGATLVIGFVQHWKPLRLFSMALMAIAMVKLTIGDFFALGTGARVIGFSVLGAVLVAASFLYQKQKDSLRSFFLSSK